MGSLILVTGAESSGTRWISSLLSQHPEITGPDGGHEDPLDDFWARRTDEIPEGNIVTRRSLPAGVDKGKAEYLDFEDFTRLEKFEPVTIVTVRHPWANMHSMVANRASVSRRFDKAMNQYRAAYLWLFEFLLRNQCPYLILPLEALVLDGEGAVQSIFRLLGFKPCNVKIEPDLHVNSKWV